MQAALLILAILMFCVWAYLLLGHGHFWRVKSNLWVPRSSLRLNPSVTVIAVVPARNEADTIGNCVTSLLRQSISDVRVIVVDDGSTDGTAETARGAAAKLGASARLAVLSGKPLPPRWTGKLWAIHQGVQHALDSRPDFLLLTDADVEHAPETIATLTAISELGPFDLTSYMVKLHCRSTAEKLLIPAFVYFFFQLYPPAWIADSCATTAGAAGGCMLIRPDTLVKAGGIEAIRSEIIDDCALARAVKSSGGDIWLGITDSSRSLRVYGAFADIGRMISRTAFNQLHHSALLLLVTVIGLLFVYLLPLALLGCGWPILASFARVGFDGWHGWPTLASFARVGFGSTYLPGFATVGISALALLMMTLSYLPMVRFYRLNPLWALTLPLAAIFYMGATVWSAVQYWSGRGGQWKGRAQDTARASMR